jgi:hypothetical protein
MSMPFRNEGARLAHCRTLEYIAEQRLSAVPDNHPQRRELASKVRAMQSKLRAQEHEYEARRGR